MEIVHKIKLDNSDIETAIELFLNGRGVDTSGKSLDIDMTGGRGGKGIYANITLTDSEDDSAEIPVSVPTKKVPPEPTPEPEVEDTTSDTENLFK